MRERTMTQLLGGQPAVLVWAIVCLPLPSQLEDWKRQETTFNGALYLHKSGLQSRCRGIEVGKVRWWHVVVGRPTSPVTKTDVSLAIHSFFPSRAIVMQVHLPDEDLDDDEVQGFIVHLWWAVDGNAGVPAVSEWQGAEGFEEPEMAPTWE